MENSTGAEAPCSWSLRYKTTDGLDAMLTLRGPSGADLLAKAEAATKWLSEHGATPDGRSHGGGHTPIGPPAPAMAMIPTPAAQATMPGVDPSWCPIHGVMMGRHEKDGKAWYSHRAGGQWCRGRAAK